MPRSPSAIDRLRVFVARGQRAQVAVDALGRPVEGPACDECGSWPARHRVDSHLGLALWNRVHPDDLRTALWFCRDECTLAAGLRLARLARLALEKDAGDA